MIKLMAKLLLALTMAELYRIVKDPHGTGHLECPTFFPADKDRGPRLGLSDIWVGLVYTLDLTNWKLGQTLSSEALRQFELPDFTGGMVRCSYRGVHGALVAVGRKLAFLDLKTGRYEYVLAGREFGIPNTRLNELYVTLQGDLLAGSMHIPCSEAVAGVDLVKPNGEQRVVIPSCTVANGMWEFNGRLYQIDSPTQEARIFKPTDQGHFERVGSLFNLGDPSAPDAQFPFIKNTDVNWRGPDGAALAGDYVLVALFNAGVVLMINPSTGKVVGLIQFPTPCCPTSVCVANVEVEGVVRPIAFFTVSAETISPKSREKIREGGQLDSSWEQNLLAAGVYYCELPAGTKILPQNELVLAM